MESSRSRPVLLLVIALVATAAAIPAVRSGSDIGDPAAWPAEVLELVAFVENERGLAFIEPVPIELLTDDEYERETGRTDDDAGSDTATEAAFDPAAALADAAGLAVPSGSGNGIETLESVGTVGFYDPQERRLVVRGTELTAPVRATLVHELTHALQDQRFGLFDNGRSEEIARRGLVEADALRIELAYVATLSAAEQDQVLADSGLDADGIAAVSDVPDWIAATFAAPYILGQGLLEWAQPNDLFDATLTSEVLVSPWLLAEPGPHEREVRMSAPEFGLVVDGPRLLGMWEVLVMFDTWLPWDQARRALDQWNGGGYVGYAAISTVCFTAAVLLDDDPTDFVAALEAWGTASGNEVTPEVSDERVTWTSCARATGAPTPPADQPSTIESARNEQLAALAAATTPDE